MGMPLLALILAAASGSSPSVVMECENRCANATALAAELDELRGQLKVPGMAVAVVRDGSVRWRHGMGHHGSPEVAFTTRTPLRIASVTKAFTAVLAIQAAERRSLKLSEPVSRYVPDFSGPPDVTIAQLLSHTSEGIPGEEYVYGSSRYALLARVLEAATGQTFERLLRARIVEPAGMQWHDSPLLGAHGGLVSTVEDLARFAAALDTGRLLRPESVRLLYQPSRSTRGGLLPVALGFFSQDIQGESVVWSYGQDDPEVGSALFLRVPRRKLTLILLGNTDALSNPFRLLMGDARKSPLAMTFLRLWVFSPPGAPLPRPHWAAGANELAAELSRLESQSGYRYSDELIGQALLRVWTGGQQGAMDLLTVGLQRYPAIVKTPDSALLFLGASLSREPLATVALEMGPKLLALHPNNRWILFFLAEFYAATAHESESVPLFERILALPNQENDFLHRLFTAWTCTALGRHWKDKDVVKARNYLQRAIDGGVGGETEANARALLASLGGIS